MNVLKQKEVLCDVCGDNITGFIGLQIELNLSELVSAHSEHTKVQNTFGKTKFSLCFVCWLKALGVKPINGDK